MRLAVATLASALLALAACSESHTPGTGECLALSPGEHGFYDLLELAATPGEVVALERGHGDRRDDRVRLVGGAAALRVHRGRSGHGRAKGDEHLGGRSHARLDILSDGVHSGARLANTPPDEPRAC